MAKHETRQAFSAQQASAPSLEDVSSWLVEKGLQGGTIEELFEGYCTRLGDLGLPVWRAHIAMRTLHPTYGSQAFTWMQDGGVERVSFLYSQSDSPMFLRSPYFWMLERDETFARWRLAGPEASRQFRLFDELAAEGATDYMTSVISFGDDGVIDGRLRFLASYSSRHPRGFSDEEIAALVRLHTRLALSIKTFLGAEITRNVVDTYVGREAGSRILSGEIRRGFHSAVPAAICFADLRNFTALTARLSSEELVSMLDAYFECMIKPILDAGGHVLKFVGDGVLASFTLQDRDAEAVSRTALEASLDSLRLMEELNARRRAAGEITTTFDMVLHAGEVFFGNVGALDRLDFTAIGPAVNEAVRIEKLCEEMGLRILVSESFATKTKCTARLRSVGHHLLRGLERPQQLYAIDDPLASA